MSTVGHECALYVNTATPEAPVWLEIITARDNNLNMSASEVDDTDRSTDGWRSKIPGLNEWGDDFEMIYDTTNLGWQKIRDTYLAQGTVEILSLDGDITVDGTEGLRGLASITEFTRAEPLEDVVANSVTFVGSGTPAWVIANGGTVTPIVS